MQPRVTYRQAPLVELIAEVRWPVATVGIPGAPPIVTGTSAVFDLWFEGLTAALRDQGFHEVERLVPHDMPPFAHQPVYRYRRPGERFPLVQFGHGLLTVNGGPPSYESWHGFRPLVAQALEALQQKRPRQAEVETASTASLRYIDAFRDPLRRGLSNFRFMQELLGVSVRLPEGFLELAESIDAIHPTVALRLPLAGQPDTTLTFQIASGRVGQPMTIDTILDMTFAVNRPIALLPDAILDVLDQAHDVLHSRFELLTRSLQDLMEPVPETEATRNPT